LNVFECTYNIFIVYFNVFIIFFHVFESIWVYLNVFECIYSIFMVYLNVFKCIYNMFQCISMCLNVFIDIVIGILPSHFHCNVFAIHTHLHIFFLPSYYAIPLHFFFPFSLIRSNFHTIHEKNYISILTSHLYITPHFTFHVVTGCVEHSGAQVNNVPWY
jgi:hypothetical protein